MQNVHPAIQAALAPFAPAAQPELDVTGRPCLQYLMGDVLLDIWTDEYKGELTIEGIALPGSKIDLSSMFSPDQMKALREHCELNLPTRSQVLSDFYEENRDAMRAERRQA